MNRYCLSQKASSTNYHWVKSSHERLPADQCSISTDVLWQFSVFACCMMHCQPRFGIVHHHRLDNKFDRLVPANPLHRYWIRCYSFLNWLNCNKIGFAQKHLILVAFECTRCFSTFCLPHEWNVCMKIEQIGRRLVTNSIVSVQFIFAHNSCVLDDQLFVRIFNLNPSKHFIFHG